MDISTGASFPAAEASFNVCSRACVSRFQQALLLTTDASDVAIGAVLEQVDSFGHAHPIAYFSRSLTSVQRRYSVMEKEVTLWWNQSAILNLFCRYVTSWHTQIIKPFSLYATQHQILQNVVFSDGKYSFSHLTFLFITSMGKGMLWPMP